MLLMSAFVLSTLIFLLTEKNNMYIMTKKEGNSKFGKLILFQINIFLRKGENKNGRNNKRFFEIYKRKI